MTSYVTKKEFASTVFHDILDPVIEWIRDNLPAEDVFSEKELQESVAEFSDPDDVFSDSELDSWAIENGYTKG